MFKATLLLAMAASASGFQLGSSFTSRMGVTQTRAGRSVGPTMAAVPCGINGFGRIGRGVARIMVKVSLFHAKSIIPDGIAIFSQCNSVLLTLDLKSCTRSHTLVPAPQPHTNTRKSAQARVHACVTNLHVRTLLVPTHAKIHAHIAQANTHTHDRPGLA